MAAVTQPSAPPGQQALPGFTRPLYDDGMTHQQRFEAFHTANPWVADALEDLAFELLTAGVNRFGVKALVERLRWDWTKAQATNGDRWRLNNNHTSRYARLLIDRHPGWAEFIECRELKAR